MKHIIGPVIGAAIDRKDGDNGVKGAILGYVASGVIKTVAKLGLLAAIGGAVVTLAKRTRSEPTGRPGVNHLSGRTHPPRGAA
jgi:hypothetical protein